MAKDTDNLVVENARGEALGIAEIDYSTMSAEELLTAIGTAFAAKDMKLMGTLSKLYTRKEGEAEKAKRDALNAELARVSADVLREITRH
ncbi:hypothetical protein LCGC14_2596240, partial [marine sediment metagenome]